MHQLMFKVNYNKDFICAFEKFHTEAWKRMNKLERLLGENKKDKLKSISVCVCVTQDVPGMERGAISFLYFRPYIKITLLQL